MDVMASVTLTIPPSQIQHRRGSELLSSRKCSNQVVFSHQIHKNKNKNFLVIEENLSMRSLLHSPRGIYIKNAHKHKAVVGSGIETSFADAAESLADIKDADADMVVESQDEHEIQISMEVPGDKTQEIYDEEFNKMVAAAQPIPGFRRVKGGKTPNIPKDILLEILGPSKVYKQVIKKVISFAVSEFVRKEGLKVSKDLRVDQSFEELEESFEPGETFSFYATVKLPETN